MVNGRSGSAAALAVLTGLTYAGSTTVGLAGATWSGCSGAATASVVTRHVPNGPLSTSQRTAALVAVKRLFLFSYRRGVYLKTIHHARLPVSEKFWSWVWDWPMIAALSTQ